MMGLGSKPKTIPITAFTLLAGLLPVDAYAYIDPGSGSLVLQLVLSGIAGALFMARRTIGRALRALSGAPRMARDQEKDGPSDNPRQTG